MKKAMNIISKVIKSLIFILLIAFIIVVVMQRVSNNKISVFDYRMFTVISGSMRPVYDIGDVLISKEVDPATIETGDVISYLGKAGDFNGKVITHEVIGIDQNTAGEYIFTAKGTANLVEDPAIHESQLYGKVVYRSWILSMVYRIVGTKLGFMLLIVVPMMFIIVTEVITTMLEKEEERRKKIKEPSEEQKKEEE